jgi:hypothetical protein
MAYFVMYVGREVPMPGYDGWAARLRLTEDGSPVQFFRAIAPAADLCVLEPKPGPDWWTEFIGLAAELIESAVDTGLKAVEDPGNPIDLRPDVAEAHRRSRAPNPNRRHYAAADVPIVGLEVRRFGSGADRDERRRAPRS